MIEPDKDMMRQFVDLLHPDAPCIELRCMGDGMFSGFYDDYDKLVDDASEFNKAGFAPYVNGQPLRDLVKSRVTNKLARAMAGACTSNPDIEFTRWLVCDLDPYRPSGVCATDAEKQAVAAKMKVVRDYFTRLGFPEGGQGDSGNGGYLFYRLDKEIEQNVNKRFYKAARQELCDLIKIVSNAVENVRTGRLGDDCHDDNQLIKQVVTATRCDEETAAKALTVAFAEFGSVPVIFDTAFSRRTQIIRLLGSVNVKGENTPERPYRQSRIIQLPDQRRVVNSEVLARLGDTYHPVRKDPQLPPYKGKYDKAVEYWLDWLTDRNAGFNDVQRHDLENGVDYVVIRFDQCPMRIENDGGAAIIVHPIRGVWGNCYHLKYAGKQLEDILFAIDPNYKETTETDVANFVLGDDDNIRKLTDPDRLARMVFRNAYEVTAHEK